MEVLTSPEVDSFRSMRTEESNGIANGHGTTTSPRPLQRDSIHRTSSGSRKGGKLANYLCGLKKKKTKERNSSGESDGSSSEIKPIKMSKSHFYYSRSTSASSSPSPTNMNLTRTSSSPTPTHESSDMDTAKLASIGSGKCEEGDDEDEINRDQNSVHYSSPVAPKEHNQNDLYLTDDIGFSYPTEGNSSEMDKSGNGTNNCNAASYTLTVHLINGKGLVIKDKNGSSDPYVKVKVGEKTQWKSKVVYANLNPVWDQSFTVPVHDLDEVLTFKVVDYDWGSKDDFMGMCLTNLRKVVPNGKVHSANLPLSMKGLAGEKPMGELSVSFTLTPRTPEEERVQLMAETTSSQSQKKTQKQTWNGMLTVLLIDVHDLPVRRRTSSLTTPDKEVGSPQASAGYSNVFAKLRLGNQKRRSKHIVETTTRPKWLEQFDFYLYDNGGSSSILEMDFFEEASAGRIPLGSVSCDISENIPKDKTTEYFLNFTNGLGRVRVAMTLTGFRESSPCQANEPLQQKYSLRNTIKLEDIRDVGHLTVKVIQAEGLRAADLGGKSDPYCVLELINSRVQTHTEYKTLTPTWNKTFEFDVRDITSKLEVTVYDEDRDHKRDFLGKVNIPLWKIQNGEAIWYKLKNRNLAKEARGNNPQILLQMELIWNPVRAAIRVTDPQEKKYCQPKPQLRIETFLVNMERLRLVLMDLYDIWLYIKSCLDWEYPERSIKALTFYLLTCYFFQPFFIPLFCLLFWLRPWWRKVVQPRRKSSLANGNASSDNADDDLNLDESDDEDGNEIKKLSLIDKFGILQDASGVLQEIVGEVAAICESTVNTYRMVVPFIYWLFAIAFATATLLLLVVDFRYVAMLFGIHEFSRVYLRPWKKSSFEVYHMIRRVPHQMNLGDKLGINSVLKSIQQLKNPANKQKFWKRGKSTSPSPTFSSGETTSSASARYVQPEQR